MNAIAQRCGAGEAGHYAARMDLSMRICVNWHPTTNLTAKFAKKIREEYVTLLRLRYHRYGIYKIELIYVQTTAKGQRQS